MRKVREEAGIELAEERKARKRAEDRARELEQDAGKVPDHIMTSWQPSKTPLTSSSGSLRGSPMRAVLHCKKSNVCAGKCRPGPRD